MTDPRLGDGLFNAIRGLPAGSGVIFRHYAVPAAERRALFRRVQRICRQRGHRLFWAGSEREAIRFRADGMHGRLPGHRIGHSAPVHDGREMAEAKRQGARLLFISPLYATRSHPGARALGLAQFASLARRARPALAIALGGMNRNRASALTCKTVHGWAAIDAFGKSQRLKIRI